MAPHFVEPRALHVGDQAVSDGFPALFDSSGAVVSHEAAGRDAKSYAAFKRLFDLTFASVLLLLTIPTLIVVAVLVKLTSPGPVIFKQTRTGRHGVPFTMFKFRTMVCDADLRLLTDDHLRSRFHDNWKLRDDPRVTRVGKWLRKSSIDELPQLVNVIRGEMSMVGPRPVQPKEAEQQYGLSTAIVFRAKPGLTGLWQVSGRSSLSYEERVALDLEYVRTRSSWTDARIVLKTIPAVLFKPDAH